MAEAKAKSVAGMSQAEINIIEEKLSSPHGILPSEIAAGLSNRFDKVMAEIDTARSKLAYIYKVKPEDRVKKIQEIKKEISEAQQKRQKLVSGWHEKVMTYIIATYGEAIKENGKTTSYGERLEVMKNKHMKKYW